jgi:hypothetical protein
MDFLYDVESVKNRPDKTVLAIQSQCPDLLLAPEVASPKLVKHLELDLGLDYIKETYDSDLYRYRREGVLCNCKCDENKCEKCDWYNCLYEVYTDTLCKDLVNFTNLTTFIVTDVKLSTELWIQFAKNSTCLERLTFESKMEVFKGEYDDIRLGAYFDEQPPKNAALDAIVKIPTLKHLSFDCVNMRYFPPGPSNIESLYLDVIDIEKYDHFFDKYRYSENVPEFKSPWNDLGFSSSFDLSGHQNLKDVKIEYIGCIKFSDLHLEKLKNLESLYIRECFIKDEEDEKSLKAILKLPNLKKYELVPVNR